MIRFEGTFQLKAQHLTSFFLGGFVTVVLKDKARPWDQARSNYSSETPKWVTLLATDFYCDDVTKEVRDMGG